MNAAEFRDAVDIALKRFKTEAQAASDRMEMEIGFLLSGFDPDKSKFTEAVTIIDDVRKENGLFP